MKSYFKQQKNEWKAVLDVDLNVSTKNLKW